MDQQQVFQPMVTMEIDAATNAKGEVNVSFRTKVQIPTSEMFEEGGRIDAGSIAELAAGLTDVAAAIATQAKANYLGMLNDFTNPTDTALLTDEFFSAESTRLWGAVRRKHAFEKMKADRVNEGIAELTGQAPEVERLPLDDVN